MLPLNIRVASWLGAECLSHYAADRGIDDRELSEFCDYIQLLIDADDVGEWDAKGASLQITGLGDPLPVHLDSGELHRLVGVVREISASQIYGRYNPEEVRSFLTDAVRISNIDLSHYNLQAMREIEPSDGWGSPISESEKRGFLK